MSITTSLPMRSTFPPRKIWIIGASEGIGAALARAYARQGAELILSARRPEPLAALARELGATALPLDLTDPQSLERAATQAALQGPLDAAINLAALYDPSPVMQADPAEAARIITANLIGSFNFARKAQPLLRHGGQLVFTGSVAGYFGLPNGQVYSASKAGVISLAESLRAELAGQTDVRLLNFGFVATRLTARNTFAMPALMQPEDAAARIVKALARTGFEAHFPRRITWPLKLLRALPYALSLPLSQRLTQ